MKCERCNSEIKTKIGTYHFVESGLDNIYLENVELHECSSRKCRAVSAAIPRINELLSTIARVIVLNDMPLTGKEAKFLRKHLGIMAKDWAALLGVERETISRWENGERPIGPQSDKMVRLLYVRLLEEKEGQLFNEKVAEKTTTSKPLRKPSSVIFSPNTPRGYKYRRVAGKAGK